RSRVRTALPKAAAGRRPAASAMAVVLSPVPLRGGSAAERSRWAGNGSRRGSAPRLRGAGRGGTALVSARGLPR
ncbi:MAG UNVERIFIED_CONTAM: hypothetical protein LOD86_15880, partial [Thermobifida fusca]